MLWLPEWHVFPCWHNNKTPMTKNGFKNAVRNPDPKNFTGKNVALVMGKISGVFSLDVDVKNEKVGAQTLEALENEHGKLPATLMFQTWSGGWQYIWRYPKDVVIPVRISFRKDLDIRSDGSYAIIPPSVVNDKPYVWIDVEEPRDDLIVEAPDWLIKIICEKKPTPKFTLPRDKDGNIPKGQQDDALFRYTCSLISLGHSEDEIRAALMALLLKCPQDKDKPFTDADVKRWMESAARYDQGAGKARLAEEQATKAIQKAQKSKEYAQKAKEKAARIEGFEKRGLIYSKQYGTLTSCQANVETILGVKYGEKFWRNDFSLTDFMDKRRVDDELENHLHSELEVDHRICFRREHIKNGIAELCAANRKNPLRDWLDGLIWDKKARIDALGLEALHAKNESATYLVRKWLISAVARVYEPGCKVDHMLVLIGKQGIGKSSALRALAGDEYFLDHIEDLRDKDTLLKFKGHWICEFQELSAMQRAQIEQVKAFITRKVDVYRAPYGHKEMVIPRMCVFAATTNDDHPIKQEDDENRRFWPVYCYEDSEIDYAGIAAARDQIWAEAVAAYKSGESLYIQDRLLLEDLKSMQRELSDTLDTWDEILQPLFLQKWFLMTDAFGKLEIDPAKQTKADIFRLARIFKRRGFVRKQIGGGEHRGKMAWIQADFQEETPWYGGSSGVSGGNVAAESV